MKAVIYLDFDGVAHPLGTPVMDESGRARPDWPGVFCWLPLLEHALRPYPDVSIVVSSSWRFLHSDDELRDMLGPLGNRFAGVTTEDHDDLSRLDEIMRHAKALGHDAFLVLDDDSSIREQERVGDRRFLWCSPETGLSKPSLLVRLHDQLRAIHVEPGNGGS